ncbi:MAG: hypothetical protein IKG18_08150 [Atopobiaceae bacterium]|nr:hypothetical protein [Atopobiaceae bacterium]
MRELVARMDQDDLISILERAIATSASSVIGAHDADFKLTAMNAATKEITGYRKRDIRPIPEDDIRSLIAAKMNEVGKACIEAGPTANVEDFGYVQEWNNRKLITVGWYGDSVDVEVLAELLYGDEQFGPGKLGVSSAGQDGEVEASWLALTNYVICSTDDSNTLRGIADTSENANAIKEWCESRGISVTIAALPPLG